MANRKEKQVATVVISEPFFQWNKRFKGGVGEATLSRTQLHIRGAAKPNGMIAGLGGSPTVAAAMAGETTMHLPYGAIADMAISGDYLTITYRAGKKGRRLRVTLKPVDFAGFEGTADLPAELLADAIRERIANRRAPPPRKK